MEHSPPCCGLPPFPPPRRVPQLLDPRDPSPCLFKPYSSRHSSHPHKWPGRYLLRRLFHPPWLSPFCPHSLDLDRSPFCSGFRSLHLRFWRHFRSSLPPHVQKMGWFHQIQGRLSPRCRLLSRNQTITILEISSGEVQTYFTSGKVYAAHSGAS